MADCLLFSRALGLSPAPSPRITPEVATLPFSKRNRRSVCVKASRRGTLVCLAGPKGQAAGVKGIRVPTRYTQMSPPFAVH